MSTKPDQVHAAGNVSGVELNFFSTGFMIPFTIAPPGHPFPPLLSVHVEASGPVHPTVWIADGGAPAYLPFNAASTYAVFTAVPEPGTVLTLACGIAMIALLRKRNALKGGPVPYV
jgi:hypothetical protein